MRRINILSILLLAATPAAFAAQQKQTVKTNAVSQKTLEAVYHATKVNLDILLQRAADNQTNVWIYQEFYKSIIHPEYIIEGHSKEILKALDLIGSNGKVPPAIREAVTAKGEIVLLKETLDRIIPPLLVLPVQYMTEQIEILLLKAHQGNISSALALFELCKKINDPAYSIQDPSTQKTLSDLHLLDAHGDPHPALRFVQIQNDSMAAAEKKVSHEAEQTHAKLDGANIGSSTKNSEK